MNNKTFSNQHESGSRYAQAAFALSASCRRAVSGNCVFAQLAPAAYFVSGRAYAADSPPPPMAPPTLPNTSRLVEAPRDTDNLVPQSLPSSYVYGGQRGIRAKKRIAVHSFFLWDCTPFCSLGMLAGDYRL
ncbi:hypothetical protein EVAR_47722_1 [Eumeta japonica]|uniref:Uncharacterized protein n=1 Tax=Eumeta variegata TaxID=151549 RepID=A0A4C1VW49_EUMVA|nr:hypothetical protein EVAR_47722_1 [Eumeta japonica]